MLNHCLLKREKTSSSAEPLISHNERCCTKKTTSSMPQHNGLGNAKCKLGAIRIQCMLAATQNTQLACRNLVPNNFVHIKYTGQYVFNSPTHCMPHSIMLWHTTHIPWSLYRAPYGHCHAPRAVYDAWENAGLAPHPTHSTQFSSVGNGGTRWRKCTRKSLQCKYMLLRNVTEKASVRILPSSWHPQLNLYWLKPMPFTAFCRLRLAEH